MQACFQTNAPQLNSLNQLSLSLFCEKKKKKCSNLLQSGSQRKPVNVKQVKNLNIISFNLLLLVALIHVVVN